MPGQYGSHLRGYLLLIVEGKSIEKFLNMAFNRGIYLWDVRKQSPNTATFKAFPSSFRSLRHVARLAGCRVRICGKYGLFFKLLRFKKRKTFLIGALVFIFALYCLSSMVWSVEVRCYDELKRLDKKEILAAAREQGIKPGAWKGNIDQKIIEKNLEKQIPELAWVGIEVRGTHVIIKIVEKNAVPRENNIEAGNLVADKDGIVEEIMVMEGEPLVEEGDTVKKGDVLISGIVGRKPAEGEGEGTKGEQPLRFVCARGIVKARVWYEAYGRCSRNLNIKKETGREQSKIIAYIGNKKIHVMGPRRVPFKNYKIEKEKTILFKEKILSYPVRFATEKVTYIETQIIKHRLSKERARELAREIALAKMENLIPSDAVVVWRQWEEKADGEEVEVRLIVETSEEIGELHSFQKSDYIQKMPDIN